MAKTLLATIFQMDFQRATTVQPVARSVTLEQIVHTSLSRLSYAELPFFSFCLLFKIETLGVPFEHRNHSLVKVVAF